ncbi:DUF6491 family protein [Rhodanobacter sp. DHG33]|uniref:DUF6491 family protein n=1 Tax=Rhodanobacter sp. DHG33 TaxID=2775921 RepID=UPI001780CA0D|nr:DUF6491 family protein [Rhodanobacter sp. DHG33]MBD8900486.1 hypothetical protein [Rhodanobacter sp. DHG33]
MFRKATWAVVALATALGACSSVPYAQRQAQRQAAYAAAAGAPVRSFNFYNLYSWEPLGNSQLVVYTQANRAWLLDVGNCPNLGFANTIGLTAFTGEVSVNFDKVITGRGFPPCFITKIRPVDVARLKLEQEAQRKIESAPREPATTAPQQ